MAGAPSETGRLADLEARGDGPSSPSGSAPATLRNLYARRFRGRLDYRTEVWRTLNESYFERWIRPSDAVLDLGSGYGEFINNVGARHRWAMDLNPDASSNLDETVILLSQDCSDRWPFADDELDVVFSSNFLEHLPSKEHVTATLGEATRCLRPGGRLILLGPNIRVVGGAYWDFYDHHVPLTDASLVEVLLLCGLEIDVAHARFLPYTMSAGRQYPTWMLRAYLRVPAAWRVLGKQFLVVAHVPA